MRGREIQRERETMGERQRGREGPWEEGERGRCHAYIFLITYIIIF